MSEKSEWNMRDRITDIVNSTVVMFAVGVLLAVAAPYVAKFLNISPEAMGKDDVFGTGAFFGAFGGIHAAVAPLLKEAFRDKNDRAREVSVAKEKSPGLTQEQVPQVNITVQHFHEPEKNSGTQWQEYVSAEHTTDLQQNSPRV